MANYTRVVGGEFLLAALILAASTVMISKARGKQLASVPPQTPGSTRALTTAMPLSRLTATCALYILLALLSSGDRTGRIAAGFGGLVVLGVVFSERDVFTAMSEIFKKGG